MHALDLKDITKYVEENIGVFHKKRIENLDHLKLSKVLERKNPYLFRAKNLQTAAEIVKGIVDAHLSSNEETIFGNWLEGLAIFVCEKVHHGRKSGIPGINLEFEKNGVRFIISIKSGPNWGNSSQIAKMRQDFKNATKTLRTSGSNLEIRAINGCCYGKPLSESDKGDYFKYCGQVFWEFISGRAEFYTEIIDPLSYKAKEKNEEFLKLYTRRINLFTRDFIQKFCDADGNIAWHQFVAFNSGTQSTE